MWDVVHTQEKGKNTHTGGEEQSCETGVQRLLKKLKQHQTDDHDLRRQWAPPTGQALKYIATTEILSVRTFEKTPFH